MRKDFVSFVFRCEDHDEISSYMATIEASLLNQELYINRIIVPEKLRGQGIANILLNSMIAYARNEKLCLIAEINAYGDGGLTAAQMLEWYLRKGFQNRPIERDVPFLILDFRGKKEGEKQ